MKYIPDFSILLNNFSWNKLFPDILWIVFWLVIILATKNFIKAAIVTLLNRLKNGAGIKIGSFELEGIKVLPNNGFQNKHFQLDSDINGLREQQRASLYSAHRGAMLVHKIYKSQTAGQLYDILIYIIPKKNCNLIQVTSVEYYFGKFWNNSIFTSNDRSNGFAIATTAYGPFLCTAKINFNDDNSEIAYRFIDFEMGEVAALSPPSKLD